MRPPVSLARLLSVWVLVLASCGGGAEGRVQPGPPAVVPVLASSDLAVGRARFLLGLVDPGSGDPAASPDLDVHVAFHHLEAAGSTASPSGRGRFVWVEPEQEGVYAVRVRFDAPGAWRADVDVGGEGPLPLEFEVMEEAAAPAVGDAAPASKTRTLQDVSAVSQISTDRDPAKRFYETSIAQAVSAKVPFVVIFGSPRFCSSAGCAHMLDVAKRISKEVSELTFIHVETYRDLDAEDPARLDPAVGEWRLSGEPWLFVVGADGRVSARFERAVSEEELRAAIDALY